jgi:hypothetical protein
MLRAKGQGRCKAGHPDGVSAKKSNVCIIAIYAGSGLESSTQAFSRIAAHTFQYF